MSPSFAARLVENSEDSTGAPAPQPKRSRSVLFAGIGAIVVIAALSSALAYNMMGGSSSSSSTTLTTIALPEPLAAPTQGTVNVYGRAFSYEVSAVDAGLVPRFSARVRDVASKTESIVFGKTSQDALEYGIEQVFHAMIKNGIVEEPKEETSQFVMVVPNAAEDKLDESERELGKSTSGDIDVLGRKIHWKASAYVSKLKLKYKATATDVATGISNSASGFKSGKGAVEHAVEGLVRILIEKGIIVVPSSPVEYKFVPEGVSATEETELTAGKSGDVRVCGRPIHWTGSAYYKFPLSIRYKCSAKDTGSGVSVSKKGYKKAEQCVKDAISEVIMADAQKGVPIDPTDNCGNSLSTNSFEFAGGMIISAAVPMGEEEIESTLGASKSGDIEVLGRKIHWKASGYLKGLKWRYKATATDKATGIAKSASGFKSGKGAVEHAVEALIRDLIEKGIIPVPPSTTAVTITDVIVEDVEDDSMDEADMDFGPDDTAVELADVVEGLASFIAGLGQTEEAWEDETEQPLSGPFSKSGKTDVYGRTISWKASGYIKGLKWRYKATATDVASGISRGSSNHKSGEGAVKGAITNVFVALDEAGIFPPRA